jgi:hypothetical protein
MTEYIPLIISLLSGIAGGNIAGAALKDKGLGTFGNSAAGFFGGGIGAAILRAIEGALHTGAGAVNETAVNAAQNLDLGSILADIGSGGVGGGVLMLIVSYIKNALYKP